MIEAIEQNEGHRINHPAFKDIYNVTYAKGVITEFEVEDTDESETHQIGQSSLAAGGEKTITTPFIAWEFTDRVKLDISGDEWIPIFYHCKLHCYDEEVASLRENKALKGSAYAFQMGDEVKVLLEEGVPKYVIGFIDNKPRMCVQHLKLSFNNEPHYSYSNPITEEEVVNEELEDYYGDVPNCDQCGEIVSIDSIKVRDGDACNDDYDYYFLIYYVKIGPVLYFFWMRIEEWTGNQENPTPIVHGDMRVFSGVWSEELEKKCKSLSSVSSWNIQDCAYPVKATGYCFYTIDHWSVPWFYNIYNLSNSYPAEMKEQKFYSLFADKTDCDFGIFWAQRISRFDFVGRVLDFYGLKMEGQSYYKKEE